MDTSRILPPGRETPTPEDVARIPASALLLACLAPRFKRLAGWQGFAHCPGGGGAWTCRLRSRPGIFGCLPEACRETDGLLAADFGLHYFPHPEEPLFDRFSLAAEMAVMAPEYRKKIRAFPEFPEMGPLFRVGRATLGLDPGRRALFSRLEALERDLVLSPGGIRASEGWVVPPGGAEQDLPAWELARELFHAVAGALTFGLGSPPEAFARSSLPGWRRVRLADGAARQEDAAGERLRGEGLAWGEAVSGREPALGLPGATDLTIWRPGNGLPGDAAADPCWLAHDPEAATLSRDDPASADRRPGLVVLSGFLGAGKTSLLLEMLEHHRAHDRFVAVIQNEIGATGVDGYLVDGGETAVTLDEGCVCCTLAGPLATGIRNLTERFRPERIILETSGLANPLNLLGEQDAWSELARLEMVVTVVDAVHGLDMLATSDIARDQARGGDILVVNKRDLAEADALRALRAALRELNPRAPILETSHGRVHPGLLFDLGAGTPEPDGTRPPAALLRRRNHMDEAFASVRLPQPEGLTLGALRRGLDRLPEGVFRVKGILRLADMPGARILQMVGRRRELLPLDRPFPDEPFLLCIGRDLDAAALERLWQG